MKKILWVAALAAAVIGCDQAKPTKPAETPAPPAAPQTEAEKAHEHKPSVPYSALKPEDAVIVIDGKALTKADLENECEIQIFLASIAKRNLTLEQTRRIRARLLDQSRRRFMLRSAVLKEAATRGYTVTPEEFTAFCSNFTQRVTRNVRKVTFEQLLMRMTEAQANVLKEGLRKDCLFQKTYAAMREESKVDVTKDEAERRFHLITRYNENARKKEAEIYANATNTWNRLKKGETFELLVAELSGQAKEIDADMDWGTFQRGFFSDDKNIYNALGTLKEGEFTPPIEGNGGLILVKLLDVQPPQPEAAAGGDFYHLAKIFYQLPEIYDLTDTEALRKQLEKEMSGQKLERKLLDLQLALKVEHPNGPVSMSSGTPGLPMMGTMPTPVAP